jgi:hypothetical protein
MKILARQEDIRPLERRTLLRGGVLATVLTMSSTFNFAQSVADTPSLSVLAELCDLVIPETDTPGAVAAGVPAFVTVAIQHGLEGAEPDFDYAAWALQSLGTDFMTLNREQRYRRLEALDRRALDRASAGNDTAPWLVVKTLIVLGYYTSEIGGAMELRYVHQPGRWDADIALQPGDRALSNDWTAVEFG